MARTRSSSDSSTDTDPAAAASDPAAAPAGAAAPADPPADDPAAELKAAFLGVFDSPPKTFENALGTPSAGIQDATTTASGLSREVPPLRFDSQKQDEFAGKRWPELSETTRLMGTGLEKHPEVEKASKVPAVIAPQLIRQDTGATNLATAGFILGQGAADGQILSGVTLSVLCSRILGEIRQAIRDPGTDPDLRSPLETAFNDAFRLEASLRSQAQDAKLKNEQATAPFAQQRDQALQISEENRVIYAFLSRTQK